MSSSMNKHIGISEDGTSEESGWTAYFEDFSLKRKENMSSCSSLVSDAAWNGFTGNVNPVKRLNFKNSNKKNSSCKKYSYDDDLEDTASSPVNSPKVSSFKQMEVNCRRTNYALTFGDLLGKQEDINGNIFTDSRNRDEHVDLKKRGLCLVPVSALMNILQ